MGEEDLHLKMRLTNIETRLAAIEGTLTKVDALLEEFVPQLRAYLDPDQAGPRGYFMRRRLAATNGATHD